MAGLVGWSPLVAHAQQDGNREAIAYIDRYKDQHLKKDEFETTATYQQRVAQFPGKSFVVVVSATNAVIGPKVFSYDADTQILTVRLVGHGSVDAVHVIGNREDAKLNPDAFLTVRFEKFSLQRVMMPPTEYHAQNAMGAQTTVQRIIGTEWSIGLLNIPYRGTLQPREVQISMAAARAKKVVENAQWKLYVTSEITPGQRDFLVNDGILKEPTVTEPTEIAVAGRMMMTTLKRAELIEPGTNEVLATFDMSADISKALTVLTTPEPSEVPARQAASAPAPSISPPAAPALPQAVTTMLPSLVAKGKGLVWVKSLEPAADSRLPSAALLGVACVDDRRLSASVGTEFVIKGTFSIFPPLTRVRFAFDTDDSHYNWQQYGPSEAGPMTGFGDFGNFSFVNGLRTAKVLKVAFEREGRAEREAVTFRLDDPALRERLAALLKACQ